MIMPFNWLRTVLDGRRVIPRVVSARQVTTGAVFTAGHESHDNDQHEDHRRDDRRYLHPAWRSGRPGFGG
jgi:hypothetical protein